MSTIHRRIVVVGLLVIAVGLYALGWVVAGSAQADAPIHRNLRACLSDEGESAFPCAWDAKHMGNGQGHSFRIYRDGRVKLISDARAFHLLGDCDSNGPIYCRVNR